MLFNIVFTICKMKSWVPCRSSGLNTNHLDKLSAAENKENHASNISWEICQPKLQIREVSKTPRGGGIKMR